MINKKEKGVTLMALTITIIVLLILAGITIYSGSDSIKRANLEGLKTNMLLIQTKAKEYIEDASFELGVNPDGRTYEAAKTYLSGEEKGTNVQDVTDQNQINAVKSAGVSNEDIEAGKVYIVSTKNIENMGIHDVESNDEEGWYVIVYDLENATAEIYHTQGYNGNHSLTDIENIEL